MTSVGQFIRVLLDGNFKVELHDEEIDFEFYGNGVTLHRDDAEKIGEALLDAVQASHNADPKPPVHRITKKQLLLNDYPKDSNIKVVDDEGKVYITLWHHVPRIVR